MVPIKITRSLRLCLFLKCPGYSPTWIWYSRQAGITDQVDWCTLKFCQQVAALIIFPLRTATVVCFYFFTKSNPPRHAIKWLAVSGYSKWIYSTVEETRKSNRSNKISIIFKHRKLTFLPLTTHETALLHGFWSEEWKTYLIGSLGECVLTHSVQLFVSPWTAAHQAPLSMGFSRQEYWSRLPFSSPGGLSNLGIEPPSLAPATLAGGLFTTAPSRKPNGTISSQNPTWKSCSVLFKQPAHAESSNIMKLNVSQKQSCFITAYSASQVVF